jgi:hypothetical protein
MMCSFKIASRLAVVVLAVSTFAMPAASKSHDQELIELINFLSTPLTTPMQFPQLDAQDLFSQDNPDDSRGHKTSFLRIRVLQ